MTSNLSIQDKHLTVFEVKSILDKAFRHFLPVFLSKSRDQGKRFSLTGVYETQT
jgi:hypothetical protein